MIDTEKFLSQIGVAGACVEYNGKRHADGGGVFVTEDGRRMSAARVAWTIAYKAPPPDDKTVRHTCKNSACVNIAHLYLSKPIKRGLSRFDVPREGYRHPFAKLSDADVVAVRQMKGRFTAPELAVRFKVSDQTIYRIWSGHTKTAAEKKQEQKHEPTADRKGQLSLIRQADTDYGPFGERQNHV